MQQDMPVGIPFYMQKRDTGYFTHQLATDRKDFSRASLDCMNYLHHNIKEFRQPNGEVYPMRTIINGEFVVKHGTKKYRVDGYIKTAKTNYFIEYYGCRLVLILRAFYIVRITSYIH